MYRRRKGRRKEEREAERGGKGMGKMEEDYIREKAEVESGVSQALWSSEVQTFRFP